MFTKKRMRPFLWVLLCSIFYLPLQAQQLKPGFDPQEYFEVMSLPERGDSASFSKKHPEKFSLVHVSPEVGFFNQFVMWKRNDGVGVIRIRGTIPKDVSWLANFYAAMIPAKGTLQLNDSTRWDYRLAGNDSTAYVHAGWTIALGFMAPGIVKQVKAMYAEGVKQFIIVGHSQGGAIAFLTRSYLQYLPGMPSDIQYKTYCSAAPKPGNLYYAYDFESITAGGWGLRIVNSEDWVPETPLSLQAKGDFNKINPFLNVDKQIKQQNLIVRWYARGVYNKMQRTTNRSVRRFQKYLGRFMYKISHRHLKELQQPAYVFSNNYMTCGTPVVLLADADYHQHFPFDGKNVFVHHAPEAYLFLLKKYYKF